MTALAKYRDQVRIARELGHCVVQTAEEAQALLDELETTNLVGGLTTTNSAPPYESDDEHAH